MEIGQLPTEAGGVGPVVKPDDDILAMLGQVSDQPAADPEADDDSQFDIEEQDDGSAIVRDLEDDDKDPEFDENLAETLPEMYLSQLGMDLTYAIESDKRVREERDKQYAEGIKRTGLGNESPGGADFDGASRAVHPMLSKGCVDFSSRASKEMLPANGPCKTKIIGDITDAKLDKAERKKSYMNWQLTTQVRENRAEFERLLSQLPLGGSQYKRWWWDAELGRPRTETVYVDDVYMPYGQADFYTSPRVTHRQFITKEVYESRIACGLYRDINLTPPPMGWQENSQARTAAEKVEGSQEDSAAYGQDGLREVYQSYVTIECEDDSFADEKSAPYIAHIDAWSGRILGLYRNWDEADARREKKHWMVEYNFIPWRGAYGIGLGHLIGSLAASGTGAVRAILDAAHIQNFPGGLKLKGGRNSGQSVSVNATELQEISAPPGVDDIRKVVMAFPFNGPSQVLFNLLEWITQQAEGVVTTASERIADGGGSDMPVGTAMALIESDSTNFSSIHARMHHSFAEELRILHRLNAENLSDREVVEDLGELVVSRADFEGPVDVIPVSDPNIFSEAQRYAQFQATMQLQANPAFAPLFKTDRLLARGLKLLQVPSPEEVVNLPKDPKRMSALQENFAISSDPETQLKVYEDQDDMMHLQGHVHYMTSPIFGGSQLIGMQALPPLVNHCKDHLLALYKKHTTAAADALMTVARMRGIPLDEDEAQMQAAAFADQAMASALGPMVMPGLQQAIQAAKQMQPQPPATPDAMLNAQTQQAIAQMKDQGDTQRRQLELQADAQRDQTQAQSKQQADAFQNAIDQANQQMNERIAQMTAQLDLIKQDREAQSRAFIVELEGQNERQLAALQAELNARLTAMPDYSLQLAQLDQRSSQVNQDLGGQLAALKEQHAKDVQAITGLLGALQQSITESKKPFWQRNP